VRGPGRLTPGLTAATLLAALLLGFAAPAAGLAASAPPAMATPSGGAPLAAWRGGVDLYRPGVFTTQQTWLWCTAADIQIARNIVFHRSDHTAAGQRAYFDWMRARNRYRLPLSAGVDAAGWTAGFQHFVDRRYRLFASTSFGAALNAAVTNLRLTGLPVGITVEHGNHAWLITGFTATADPARTTAFTVTSVRVVGPLYGLQSRNGYDMPPDTRLTPAQLRRFFTPWWYAPTRMVWDGRYVSIQPVAARAAAAAASPTVKPAATTAPSPRPTDPSPATPSSAMASAGLGAVAPTGAAPSAAPLTALAGTATTDPATPETPPPSPSAAIAGGSSTPAEPSTAPDDSGPSLPVLVIIGLAGIGLGILAGRRGARRRL
jgi:hypothetical protein